MTAISSNHPLAKNQFQTNEELTIDWAVRTLAREIGGSRGIEIRDLWYQRKHRDQAGAQKIEVAVGRLLAKATRENLIQPSEFVREYFGELRWEA